MSDSPNATLVRHLYDSAMAPDVVAEIIAPDLIWDITPGFPGAGVYHGWESVGRDYFGKIMPDFESFSAQPAQFFAAGDDHVFVVGHYHAVTNSGNTADVRFIHLWTVHDGQLTHMQQAADSHVLQEALKG